MLGVPVLVPQMWLIWIEAMATTTEEETNKKKPLTLSRPGRLEIKKTVEGGQVKQSFSHGRSKTVTVEVKKKRTFRQEKLLNFCYLAVSGHTGGREKDRF